MISPTKMKDKIKPYIEQKYISEQKHPKLDLWIYNYTPKCQYEQRWDNITMMCRGLILDKEGNIIARPFKKFFNYEEHIQKGYEIPNEDFEVYEKYDGSLGILYFDGNIPNLATRGSFTSEQAVKGTEILQRDFLHYPFRRDWTYLFEIIYPENRIVVDYGGKEEVILLAVIDTKTGRELPLNQFNGFHIAQRYDGIKDISKLKERQEENKEGYVIRFASGLRIKLKFEEYVRLHRLVTETNSKRIWEYLKDKRPVEELLVRVPDEFYKWVKDTIAKLENQYRILEEEAKTEFQKIKHIGIRKDFAEQAKKQRTKAILFRMLDNKDYAEVIWKMIKPKAENPFKTEI